VSLAQRIARDAPVASRIAGYDWQGTAAALDERGAAVLPRVLAPAECAALIAHYRDEALFRSRIVMARHNFGRGEYKYFAYPLPDTIAALREALYPHLAPIANRWYGAMRLSPRFPEALAAFLARCHEAGQTKPTPLMLHYETGDYNCLHQDLYGEHVFPIQATILLSAPGGFSGGEFVLTEQRPRMQSRAEVVPLEEGDGVLFAVRERPVTSARGSYRVTMRHGVSRVRSGERFTLGIIFHDGR
jgi:uncharacterized protein